MSERDPYSESMPKRACPICERTFYFDDAAAPKHDNANCRDCFCEWYDGDRPNTADRDTWNAIGRHIRAKHNLPPIEWHAEDAT